APDDDRALPRWFIQRGGTGRVVGCDRRIRKQRIGKSAAWKAAFFLSGVSSRVAAAAGCVRLRSSRKPDPAGFQVYRGAWFCEDYDRARPRPERSLRQLLGGFCIRPNTL